jgi:toxin ParE1/3/4
MEIRWSTLAADDLERIFLRIEKDNPTAARETVKAIHDGCQALKDFPQLGRPGRISGRRELVFSPYIAVYQIKERTVEISAFTMAPRSGPKKARHVSGEIESRKARGPDCAARTAPLKPNRLEWATGQGAVLQRR